MDKAEAGAETSAGGSTPALRIVANETEREDLTLGLDETCQRGARRVLAAALRAEAGAYVEAVAGERDEDGRALVTRNGRARPRQLVTGAGALEVRAPRVNDRRTDPETGERRRFAGEILPPYARRSAKVDDVLPLLYLHGLSTGHFAPGPQRVLGTGAGLSPTAVTRLTEVWRGSGRTFMARDLSAADYVYIWVDGTHVSVRLGGAAEVRTCPREAGHPGDHPRGGTGRARTGPWTASPRSSGCSARRPLRRSRASGGGSPPSPSSRPPTGSTAHHDPHRVDLRPGAGAPTHLTTGPGSRQAGLAMLFKLPHAAEGRSRRINEEEHGEEDAA